LAESSKNGRIFGNFNIPEGLEIQKLHKALAWGTDQVMNVIPLINGAHIDVILNLD